MSSTTRDCGDLEKIIFTKGVNNVIVPAWLKTTQALDEKLLQQSVVHLISVQPNLRSRVVKDGNEQIKFEVISNPDQDVFEVLPAEFDLNKLFEKYSNEPLRNDNTGAPVKVFYQRESESKSCLIVVYMHIVADGTNGMTMVNDILTNYSCLRRSEALVDPHFSQPPSVESMASAASNRMQSIESKMIDDTKRKLSFSNTSFTKDGGKQKAILYTSSKEEYDRFLECCRKNGTTVGGALCAALYFGYVSLLQEKNENPVTVALNLPVNLRNRSPLSIPKNQCNLSVTQVVCCQSVATDTKFWQLAKDSRSEINSILEAECHLSDFVVNKALKPILDERREKYGRSLDVCLSNMGRYPGKSLEYADCALESIHCLGGVWTYQWTEMELMIYSTDRFNLSLIYFDGPNKKERTQHVMDAIGHIIKNITSIKDDFNLEDLKKISY